MAARGRETFPGAVPRRLRFRPPPWLVNRKVKVTRTGYFFILIIALLGAAAFNTGNNLLYLVLSMLLGSLLFSFSISEYMIADIRIERSHPEVVTEDNRFIVSYRIDNGNRLVPALALVVSERLGHDSILAMTPFLRAGKQVAVRGTAAATGRGRRQFGGAEVSTSAPFGWFDKSRAITLPGEIIVLPRTDLYRVDLETMLALGDQKPRNVRGRGDELFGFRDYTRGDQVKDVHWKITAKTGKLVIKERESEEERRVRFELAPGVDPKSREAAVRKAAAMVEAAVELGWLVRIEVDGRGVDYGSGPSHLREMLVFLALFDDPDAPAGTLLPPPDSEAVIIG